MFEALKGKLGAFSALSGATDIASVLPLLQQYGVTGEVVSRDVESARALLKGVAHAIGGANSEVIKLTGEVNGRRVFAVVVSAEPVIVENPAALVEPLALAEKN